MASDFPMRGARPKLVEAGERGRGNVLLPSRPVKMPVEVARKRYAGEPFCASSGPACENHIDIKLSAV